MDAIHRPAKFGYDIWPEARPWQMSATAFRLKSIGALCPSYLLLTRWRPASNLSKAAAQSDEAAGGHNDVQSQTSDMVIGFTPKTYQPPPEATNSQHSHHIITWSLSGVVWDVSGLSQCRCPIETSGCVSLRAVTSSQMKFTCMAPLPLVQNLHRGTTSLTFRRRSRTVRGSCTV
jgi:hypothetical protein